MGAYIRPTQAEPEMEALMCIGGVPVAASDAVPVGRRLLMSPAADARAS